ncbi:MAG: hypothetical protein GX754_12110 [Clostridiaceae bacterium]|nr:hypothetical protein [Clostridiaceae bacterium]
MEKREALDILGVKEDAPKSEIEKRYAIALRKYRSGNIEGLAEEQFNRVTEAYNLLMGYTIEPGDDEKKRKKPNPVLKKLGIDEEKLRNFLHYYKFHVVGGILILAAVVSMVRGCVNRVEPDLSVVFMGSVYCAKQGQFEEDVKSLIDGVKEISTENIPISEAQERQDPQVQMAMLQKAMLVISVGEADVILLDEAQFEKFAKQGAFMKLEDIPAIMNLPEDKLAVEQVEEEDMKGNVTIVDEGVYGIILERGKVFTDSMVVGEEIIAAISIKSKNYDNAVKLIELLINDVKEE